MNAGQLYPCTVATQLTLLLGGFDRCAVGQHLSELRILAMPAASPWQATYSGVADARIAAATAAFPDAKFVRSGKQVTCTGLTAAHLLLLDGPSRRTTGGPKRATNRPPQSSQRPADQQHMNEHPTQDEREKMVDVLVGKQRYTIKQDQPQPLRSVMTALGKQLGLEVHWSSALRPADVQKPVTLDVKDARLDEIFATLAAQAGVSIVRSGLTVEVAPVAAEGNSNPAAVPAPNPRGE
jgi:hypothetical protein